MQDDKSNTRKMKDVASCFYQKRYS